MWLSLAFAKDSLPFLVVRPSAVPIKPGASRIEVGIGAGPAIGSNVAGQLGLSKHFSMLATVDTHLVDFSFRPFPIADAQLSMSGTACSGDLCLGGFVRGGYGVNWLNYDRGPYPSVTVGSTFHYSRGRNQIDVSMPLAAYDIENSNTRFTSAERFGRRVVSDLRVSYTFAAGRSLDLRLGFEPITYLSLRIRTRAGLLLEPFIGIPVIGMKVEFPRF